MRTLRKTVLVAAFAAALPLSAQAQDAQLESMLAGVGPDYAAARDALVADAAALPGLRERVAGATWTDTSWELDAMATIALARATDPAPFARVAALEGVRPSHYLQRRRPDPECFRELRRMGADAAPAILELILKTQAAYPFVGDYPEQTEAAARDGYRAAERLALHEGLVLALGSTKHPAARFALVAELDASRPLPIRLAAAGALGETGAPAALETLARIAADDAQAVELRGAAIAGAARVRIPATLTLLRSYALGENAALRKAAHAGLGLFGSSWAWEASRQVEAGQALRRQACELLVEAFVQTPSDAIVQSLTTVAHPIGLELLGALVEGQDTPPALRNGAERARARLEQVLARRR